VSVAALTAARVARGRHVQGSALGQPLDVIQPGPVSVRGPEWAHRPERGHGLYEQAIAVLLSGLLFVVALVLLRRRRALHLNSADDAIERFDIVWPPWEYNSPIQIRV
jgi:hypothetical protein